MNKDAFSNEIIAFVSGKGGVGKTIIAANLAALLAKSGIKILLIDSDFATRGLTFYLLKGRKEINKNNCYFNYLIGEVDISQLQPMKIEQNFHIIPAISFTWLKTPVEIKQSSFMLMYERLSKLLDKFRKSFDIIIFDTRSGADEISLLPAELSNGFIIVSEEDFTSWRTSILIRDSIQKSAALRDMFPIFTGFVLNRVIEEQPEEIVTFLESRWFETEMLAVILYETKVKRAFLSDNLVIERFPDAEFSSIMCDIALKIFKQIKKEKKNNLLDMRNIFLESKEKAKQKEHIPIRRLRLQSLVFIYLAIALVVASFWFKYDILLYMALVSFAMVLGWITYEINRIYALLFKKNLTISK